ncbi:hypothetical protein [Saccharopolyspora endophytica]|uniref:Methyl-accepting chemotaxis protein n=1 Tax=Saccharopolyspora endophytica TaxID=543886 RepID=A0ABS5DKC3_9PSEU|nr:hypothetical protein [Saccharopolyspora endophytica]MBQ0926738.1 hypothetical protein [Saccharopolyspora endophytica]
MSGIEEIRAGISLANEQGREAIAAIQQAVTKLEEAQGTLARITEGTTQDEVVAASGGLAEAIQSLGGAQGTVNVSLEATEGYASRL